MLHRSKRPWCRESKYAFPEDSAQYPSLPRCFGSANKIRRRIAHPKRIQNLSALTPRERLPTHYALLFVDFLGDTRVEKPLELVHHNPPPP